MACFSNYKEALDYLYDTFPMFSHSGGKAYKPGLATSLELASEFGNPHDTFRSIHIAGTNGKGSTSHLIASILQAQGYKVGLYTSPHLIDFRERIRINGKMIPENMVMEFLNQWLDKNLPLSPSFYEITMMMAFKWFADEKVDFAVIEVGMGGRLDSTNIITPILSVITNISRDHDQFLGNTLQEIASEKAGIIKTGIPVVIGESQEETLQVFIDKAESTRSLLMEAEKKITDISLKRSQKGWEGNYGDIHFNLPLGGDYQKKNIITVLASVLQLKDLGIIIEKPAIEKGIKEVVTSTGLQGRWMIVSQEPLVIADTGHNQAGFESNFMQLKELARERKGKIMAVLGVMADKAIDSIAAQLPHEANYFLTKADVPRAMATQELKRIFSKYGLSAQTFPEVATAFVNAKKEASLQDIIFVGGSNLIVADFLLYLDSCAGRDS